MTKEEIRMIRFSRIIRDPFPGHSEYESLKGYESKIFKFFGIGKSVLQKPERISIWKAYRLGYEQAYKEIEEML